MKNKHLKNLLITIFIAIALPIFYALVYKLITFHILDAFVGLDSGDSFINFLYFSFITITTTGHGDIYPVSGLAKAVVTTEIVIGIVLVSLLVYYNVLRIKSKN